MEPTQRPYGAPEPSEIDTTEDRIGSVHPLDFNDPNGDGPAGFTGDALEDEAMASPQRVNEAGLTGASTDDHHQTMDDMSPETLIREDGSESVEEAELSGAPADLQLNPVDEDDIGGGDGLDEAELARLDPLDGKKWDGEAE
ncbi:MULTISPECIES: serine kinase/phosphatase [Pseudomonas]|uniref:serine kinase/phosphatase n=1 Tax=Pseudomonas TaxID=286 RepID=UPI0015E3FC95|nr:MULTISPECIES: serine kinase/phosphatase [Pseudomonas]MBA1244518.1 serine kinase/phosphatase [Pseudomonas japonica]MBA1290035.1 serine kinase/phosphatase [Pseudomonas japonica]